MAHRLTLDPGSTLCFETKGRSKRWPSLAQAQRARPATLEKFFRAHNCRSRERIQRRLEAIRQAKPLSEDRAVLEPAQLWVGMLVRMIEVLRRAAWQTVTGRSAR